jgi:hypothetical protein
MKTPNPKVTVRTTVPKIAPTPKIASTPKLSTGGAKFGNKFKRLAPKTVSAKMRTPKTGGSSTMKSFSKQFDPSSNIK